MSERDWGEGTRAVHAGLPEPAPGRAVPARPGARRALPPGRRPRGRALRLQPRRQPDLGALRGGAGRARGRGGRALRLRHGGRRPPSCCPVLDREVPVVVPADGYPGARAMAREQLEPRGVEVRARADRRRAICAPRSTAPRSCSSRRRRNPRLDVVRRRRRSAEAAHAAGALVAVDNTLATPLRPAPARPRRRPLDHQRLEDRDRPQRPDAWATSPPATPSAPPRCAPGARAPARCPGRSRRGSRTARWRRCTCASTARARTRWRSRSCSRRTHDVAGGPLPRPARRPRPRGGAPPDAPLRAGRRASRWRAPSAPSASSPPPSWCIEATSFGGVHTTAERRGRWGTDDVPEGFIRFSAGCEDAPDLLADVAAGAGRRPRLRAGSAALCRLDGRMRPQTTQRHRAAPSSRGSGLNRPPAYPRRTPWPARPPSTSARSCGHQRPRWHGQCPGCGEWNTLVEEAAPRAGGPRRRRKRRARSPRGRARCAARRRARRAPARASRPGSASSTACSAAGSCPARSS